MNRQRGDDMGRVLAGILAGFFAGGWLSIMVMYAALVLFAEHDDYFMPDDLLWLLLSPAVLFLGGVIGAAIGAVLAEREVR
jgi:uncharacterized membrane protein YfcA